MNYHIGRLVLSSLCVGAFGAAGFWWCSFCRLKPAKRTPPNNSRNKSSNTKRTENKTTDVVIQQHSHKLLKMDILMSETCWAHNKWNKITSDIKLVFHSSTILLWISSTNISYPEVSPLLATRIELILDDYLSHWMQILKCPSSNSFPNSHSLVIVLEAIQYSIMKVKHAIKIYGGDRRYSSIHSSIHIYFISTVNTQHMQRPDVVLQLGYIFILNLGPEWRWAVFFMVRPLYTGSFKKIWTSSTLATEVTGPDTLWCFSMGIR